MNYAKSAQNIEGFRDLDNECPQNVFVVQHDLIKLLVLDPIYPLSLVKLTFDIAKLFSEAGFTNLVNEPNILFIFNLVDQFGNGFDSWMLLLVHGIATDEIFILLSVGSILNLQREQGVAGLDLDLGRVINWYAFNLWELLQGYSHANHLFAVSIPFAIAYFSEPDHGNSSLSKKALLPESLRAPITKLLLLVRLKQRGKALFLFPQQHDNARLCAHAPPRAPNEGGRYDRRRPHPSQRPDGGSKIVERSGARALDDLHLQWWRFHFPDENSPVKRQ